MDKPVKYLPNGTLSNLSLNAFRITGMDKDDPLSLWNGKCGTDVYSGSKMDALWTDLFPRQAAHTEYFLDNLQEQSPSIAPNVRQNLSHIAGGLSCMFYLLHTNHPLCKQANHLNNHDWEFWSTVERIFLVGHLVEGQTGKYVESEIQRHLLRLGIQNLRVNRFESSVTPSLIGCAKSGCPFESVFVFDFGASMTKCGRISGSGKNRKVQEFPPRKTLPIRNAKNQTECAEQLHHYILEVILSTISKQATSQLAGPISISMCIANNIMNGKISDRGFFAPLGTLAPFYSDFLKHSLEDGLQRPVVLSIQNDAEAVARLFTNYEPYAAVVTFGTAMGIAYPRAESEGNRVMQQTSF